MTDKTAVAPFQGDQRTLLHLPQLSFTSTHHTFTEITSCTLSACEKY